MKTFDYSFLLGTKLIHCLVGVYLNGARKFIDVPDNMLKKEIEYDLQFRFGRALFVDGTLVYTGYLGIDRCRKIERELSEK